MASTSGLSGQASAPSPSSSATPPASIGSSSTGRESLSTGTSTPSQASLFADLWTSSAEDSHASRSASLGSRKGPKTSGTSGPRCHESSEKFDPVGYSLRTFLASELSRLTSSSKTWKDRGTPAGRSWWVLMTLERRTVARGCGLSQGSDWPTPTGAVKNWATPAERDWRSDRSQKTRDEMYGKKGRPLPRMAMESLGLAAPESHSTLGKPQDWPTPNAADAIGGKGPRIGMSQTGRMPDGSKAMVNLRAAIVLKDAEFLDRFAPSNEWPTPRANRHGAPDSHGKTPIRGSLNPRWVAQLMGFPTDWLDSVPPTGGKR